MSIKGFIITDYLISNSQAEFNLPSYFIIFHERNRKYLKQLLLKESD